MAFGETVDASTAKVILKMLEAGMRKRVVAELAETSVSTVKRVRRHADDNSGALRDPKPGAGRTHDPRWHFGGIAGVANTALLDRVASRMDASSTHEEIYMEYVKWCPQPAPKPATVSEQLRKLDFSCKRLSSCNPDRNAARCAAWHARVSQLYSRRQLICIDEVGCSKKASNRNRGISKKGTPAVTHLNVLAGGRKFSGLGVFSQDGFVGMHVVDGAFNAESFLDAVDRVVVRTRATRLPLPASRARPRARACRRPAPRLSRPRSFRRCSRTRARGASSSWTIAASTRSMSSWPGCGPSARVSSSSSPTTRSICRSRWAFAR